MLDTYNVIFERAQFGWRCTIWFACVTHRQFTSEYQYADDGSRFWLVAFFKAYRAALRKRSGLQAEAGPFNNVVEG